MPVPQQPQPPNLTSDDARRPHTLAVTWPDAIGATSYNARITDEDGNTTDQTSVVRPLTFGGLISTKKYTIAVQAKNAEGVSPFSSDFVTRTRPQTPNAPAVFQDVVMPVHLVKWHILGPPGGFVALRRIGNGSDQIVLNNGPLIGDKPFSSIPSGLTWEFLVSVALAQTDVPGGMNESFWSPPTQVTTVEAVSSSPALRSTSGVAFLRRQIRH